MPKKIRQKHLNYHLKASTAVYSDNEGDAETAQYFITNTFRDFSALNRQNIEQVSRQGDLKMVGLNITCSGSRIAASVDPGSEAPTGANDVQSQAFFYPPTVRADGTEVESDHKGNGLVSVRFFAPLNTWVLANAVKKAHFAREEMFKKAMVPKEARGAYSHSLRLGLTAGSESYSTPITTTSGTNIAGGTWDVSRIHWEPDTDGALLKLTGSHATEETNTTFADLNIQQMYLASRSGKMDDDTNEDALVQAKFSVLNALLTPDTTDASDEVVVTAKAEQDNPPYDLTDVGNDVTDLIEVGRLQFNPSTGGMASTYIEVPGGIFRTQVYLGDIRGDRDVNWEMDMQCDLVKMGDC